jgi:hypothetical protein
MNKVKSPALSMPVGPALAAGMPAALPRALAAAVVALARPANSRVCMPTLPLPALQPGQGLNSALRSKDRLGFPAAPV